MQNWKVSQSKALAKALYRNIHIARTSKDYAMKFPNEVKTNPKALVLKECHPEARKRIEHDFKIRVSNAFAPAVERPKRMNRVG